MTCRIHIPVPLRPSTGGSPEITVAGETAGGLLAALAHAHPGVRKHLYTETGAVRSFVHIFVNGHAVARLDQRVTASDTVELVLAIAGGGAA